MALVASSDTEANADEINEPVLLGGEEVETDCVVAGCACAFGCGGGGRAGGACPLLFSLTSRRDVVDDEDSLLIIEGFYFGFFYRFSYSCLILSCL